jgi:hypothetical protein
MESSRKSTEESETVNTHELKKTFFLAQLAIPVCILVEQKLIGPAP